MNVPHILKPEAICKCCIKVLNLKRSLIFPCFFYSNYSKTYKIFIEIQGNSHLDKKRLDLDKTRARRNIDEGDILIIQY